MGWVTLDDGQHIWIGPKGNVEPRSPGSKSEATVAKARKEVAKAAAHKAARQPKNPPVQARTDPPR